MDIYEKQINNFIEKIDKLEISNEEKINYLKIYSKVLNKRKDEIENNFIMGTFISSLGLGTMLNISNTYFSVVLIGSGIILSLYKAGKLNKNINIEEVKQYKRSR